jgi:hypothetical protein
LGFDLRTLAVVCVAACAACGGSSKPGAPAPPSGGGSGGSGNDPISVTGAESIGWDQEAASNSEAAGFRYLVYVDNTERAITDVQCGGSGTVFGCQTRLPTLTAGVHRLELTAARLVNGAYIESPKSTAITVLMSVRATAPASSLTSSAPDAIAVNGCSALAIGGPAGDVIVADTSGIRRVRPGAEARGTVLLEPDPVDPAVLSLAVHPAFQRTRFIYVLKNSGSDDRGYRLQLVRYREVGGTMGERAVLLDRAVDGRYASGRLRFDGAGRLYAGMWGGTRPGLLLRLMEDGRIGDDSSDRSGLVPGVETMRGFDVEPGTGRVWILQETADRIFALRTLTLAGAEEIETVPLEEAPMQIAVRADTSGQAVSQIWAAFAEDAPVLLRRNSGGALTAAAGPVPLSDPIGDLAFAQSGALLACAADVRGGSGSRVVRLEPAIGRTRGGL